MCVCGASIITSHFVNVVVLYQKVLEVKDGVARLYTQPELKKYLQPELKSTCKDFQTSSNNISWLIMTEEFKKAGKCCWVAEVLIVILLVEWGSYPFSCQLFKP